MGSRVVPQKILVLDPMLGWGEPTYGFVHDFCTCFLDVMVFGPWFWTQWFLVHGIELFGMYKYVL